MLDDDFDTEDQDLDYGSGDDEDGGGYLDPAYMNDAGPAPRVGPTKEAAAAGDINYGGDGGLQEYENRQINAIQGLRDARMRAAQALRPTDDKSRYLALAAGFLSPTRTGGFGESVGNALQSYLPYKQQQRQEEMAYKGALANYDTQIAQAEYNQALKDPKIIEVYTKDGRRQKAAIINGRIHPIGGSYLPPTRGAMGPLDKVKQLQQMTPEELRLWDQYGRTQPMSMTITENKEAAKKLGDWDAEMYSNIQKEALKAPITIANYQRQGSLLSQIRTGKYRGTINEFAKALQTFGFDPAAIGIDAHTGIVDAANAAQREMALQLRNPAGGAGMPGALSDSDRDFLTSMAPGVETSAEAIPLMTGWQIKLAKRSQDVFRLAREYKKKHGTVDDGFTDELTAWSEAHPLFTDQDRQDIERVGGANSPATDHPASGSIVDNPGGQFK